MSNIEGTSRAQTDFLRKLKNNPLGLTAEEWPSAIVLRRWMRRSRFRRLLDSIQRALHVQADVHLSAAVVRASAGLQNALAGGIDEGSRAQLSMLVSLLRMAHQRVRHVDQLKQHAVIHKKPQPQIIHPGHPPYTRRMVLNELKAARAGVSSEELAQMRAKRMALIAEREGRVVR